MQLALQVLGDTLNRILQRDAERLAQFTTYAGRTVALDLTDFPFVLQAEIHTTGLRLALGEDPAADLTIRASSWDCLKLTRDPQHLFAPTVRIHGDVQFAKALQTWAQGLDFDWEGAIAQWTGDTLSYPIIEGFKSGRQWAQSARESLGMSLAEFLKEEVRMLPDPLEVTHWMQQIDQLRADCDRLEARVARLTPAAQQEP